MPNDDVKHQIDEIAGSRFKSTTGKARMDLVRQLVRASHDAPIENWTVLSEKSEEGPYMSDPTWYDKLWLKNDLYRKWITARSGRPLLKALDKGNVVFAVDPGRDPAAYAHEVGHASRPGILDNAVYQTSSVIDRSILPKLLLTALQFGGMATRKPLLTAAGAVPKIMGSLSTLIEESRASRRGKELLERIGKPISDKGSERLDTAWKTYARASVPAVGLDALTIFLSKMNS